MALGDLNPFQYNPEFKQPLQCSFLKHCGKRRNGWQPVFSSFPTLFSTLSESKSTLLPYLICCLQIILNFEFLLFGKELTHNHILKLYIGKVTRLHPDSDRSFDLIWFWTAKFWLLKIFGWRHPSSYNEGETANYTVKDTKLCKHLHHFQSQLLFFHQSQPSVLEKTLGMCPTLLRLRTFL